MARLIGSGDTFYITRGGDCEENKQERDKRKRRDNKNSDVDASNSNEKRIQRWFAGTVQRHKYFERFENVRNVEELKGMPDMPEPLIRGSCDGIPKWVDRVGCCGNAVVPQVAEFIGRRIVEAEGA